MLCDDVSSVLAYLLANVDVTSAVLAGGRSSRLRRNKLFQRVAGKSLIEWVIGRVAAMSGEVVVVVSERDMVRAVRESADRLWHQAAAANPYRVRVVEDIVHGCGPLGGIYTALTSSSSPRCIVVGCDMPFLKRELLEYLVHASCGYDATVPRMGSFIEPLCAVYHRDCIPHFAQAMGRGELQIRHALRRVKTRFVEEAQIAAVDPQHYSFFNVNTRSELEEARRLAAQNPQLLRAPAEQGKEKW